MLFRFDKNKIDYALCGGLALAVYARPRATLDIDIMVEPDFLGKVKQIAENLGVITGTALTIWLGYWLAKKFFK